MMISANPMAIAAAAGPTPTTQVAGGGEAMPDFGDMLAALSTVPGSEAAMDAEPVDSGDAPAVTDAGDETPMAGSDTEAAMTGLVVPPVLILAAAAVPAVSIVTPSGEPVESAPASLRPAVPTVAAIAADPARSASTKTAGLVSRAIEAPPATTTSAVAGPPSTTSIASEAPTLSPAALAGFGRRGAAAAPVTVAAVAVASPAPLTSGSVQVEIVRQAKTIAANAAPPTAVIAAADDAAAAPVAAIMRDVGQLLTRNDAVLVSALPVAAPAPVTDTAAALQRAPQPVMPTPAPPVGVAEATIREQVAAMVPLRSEEQLEVEPDAPVAASAAPVAISTATTASMSPAVPALSPAAAVDLHVDAAQHGQMLDGVTRDISIATGAGDAPMRFRIDPARLGPITVELAHGADGLDVRIEARGDMRDLIADQQPRLMADARAAGVRVATLQVEARRDESAQPSPSAGAQQQSSTGGQAGHQAGQQGGQAAGQAGGHQGGQRGQQPAAPGWTIKSRGSGEIAGKTSGSNELYA